MSKLISGKEALIALANGEDVEVRFKSTPDIGWCSVGTTKIQSIQKILEGGDEFRIKPRTITINAPRHTAQRLSGRKVEITFESHNDASVFFNEMKEVMFNDH